MNMFFWKLCSGMLAAVLLAATACETAPRRDPIEGDKVSENFRESSIVDVMVMPVVNEVPEEELPVDKAFTFPEAHARQVMRRFLIDEKDFVVPTAAWTDSVEPKLRDTDALLTMTLKQWDASRLVRRGVIYAGAKFVMTSEKSKRAVWEYECYDLQISVDPPHGGQAAEGNMRDAAKKLVDQVLARIPKKITE